VWPQGGAKARQRHLSSLDWTQAVDQSTRTLVQNGALHEQVRGRLRTTVLRRLHGAICRGGSFVDSRRVVKMDLPWQALLRGAFGGGGGGGAVVNNLLWGTEFFRWWILVGVLCAGRGAGRC